MGYYLNLIFEPDEVNHYEAIIERLFKAGAQEVSIDMANVKHHANRLLHPDVPFFITVLRNKTDSTQVICIDIRLSWGLGVNDLDEYLRSILKFANDIGCKVYDGQLHEYVTRKNMHKIIDFYSMVRKQVKDLFGITDIKKVDQRIWNKKYLSITREINPNDPILYKKVGELDLSIRPLNCLKKAHIDYVGELVQKTYEELRAIPNMGRRSVDQIREVLAEMGLRLGTKFDKWLKEDAEKLLARIVTPYN